MKKYFLQLVLIISGCSVYSQEYTIKGTIIDTTINEILPFVNIILINQNYKDTLYTTSDIDGNFSFTNLNKGLFTIKTSYVGYSPIDTSIIITNHENIIIINPKNINGIIDMIYIDIINKEGAIIDIEKHEQKIFLPGGFISSTITKEDSIFEKKYQIKFISQGCVKFEGENELEYNQEIFKYLDKKYGKKWRNEIRIDAIGLN